MSLIALAAALFAACALILSGCGNSPASDNAAKTPEVKQAPKKRLYPVRTAVVAVRAVQYEFKAVGTVEAQDVYRVDARVPGTLYDCNFVEGDAVTKDDILCKIAPEAYRQYALKAKAMYDQAVAQHSDFKRKSANDIERTKIKLSEASLEIARRKAVKEAGAISEEEVQLYQSRRDLAALELKDATEAAESELKVLAATIAQRDAELKIAEEDVRKSIVMPPIAGVIEKRLVTTGMFATSGMPLAIIVDTRSLKLVFKVSEKDSAATHVGEKVAFEVPAWPGRSFEAEIYFIAKQLESQTRVTTCYARVTRELDKLKPGYFASVKIITGNRERAVVAPTMAILPSEKGFLAFVIKEGKAEQRFVKLGMTLTDNEHEVLSGLKEGETIVVEGANALQPGVAVRILNDERKPDLNEKKPGDTAVEASSERSP